MLFLLRKSVRKWVYKMLENAIAVTASLIIAAIMVYVLDKKFSGTDDSDINT